MLAFLEAYFRSNLPPFERDLHLLLSWTHTMFSFFDLIYSAALFFYFFSLFGLGAIFLVNPVNLGLLCRELE